MAGASRRILSRTALLRCVTSPRHANNARCYAIDAVAAAMPMPLRRHAAIRYDACCAIYATLIDAAMLLLPSIR